MNETDLKMLEVRDLLKADGKIRFFKQFYAVIKISKENVYRIEKGLGVHFTREQIYLACSEYGINANFIFGFEKSMYRKGITK